MVTTCLPAQQFCAQARIWANRVVPRRSSLSRSEERWRGLRPRVIVTPPSPVRPPPSPTGMVSSNSVGPRVVGQPEARTIIVDEGGRFRGSRRKGQAVGGGLGLALAPSTLAVLAFCNSEFDAHFERVWSFFCRELCSLFFPLLVRGSKPASAREP